MKTVGRGLGFWGDMVVTLRNGDKIELRSLPKSVSAPASNTCMLDQRQPRGGTQSWKAASSVFGIFYVQDNDLQPHGAGSWSFATTS